LRPTFKSPETVASLLLAEETWEHNYTLMFSIECLMAECEQAANPGLAFDEISLQVAALQLACRATSGG
jgi:hypothetical protein